MKKIIAFSFISAIFLSFAFPVFAGLGISPSDWIEENGLAGQTMEKTFMLSRGNPDQDLYFTSEITGDMASWIKIDNGNSFVMPKGQQQYPVKLIVSIPKTAEFKNYKGEVRLKSETKESPKAGAAPIGVLLSSLIRIDLTVSDKKVLSYQVLQINIPTQEAGKPLDMVLKIWNEGNVEAKPTKITMEIFDKFNTTKLGEKTITDFSGIEGVGSFSEGTIKVPFSLQLEPEQYWAKIDVYQDDKILKSDDVTFDIVKELPHSKKNTTIKNGATPSVVSTVAKGLVLVLLLVALMVFVGRFLMITLKHYADKKHGKIDIRKIDHEKKG